MHSNCLLYCPCRYNQWLYTKSVDRAYNSGWKVRNIGAAQRRFLQKDWKLIQKLRRSKNVNVMNEIGSLKNELNKVENKRTENRELASTFEKS